LRVLKRKLQKEGFFKVVKMKSTYEKPSEKKKKIKEEKIKASQETATEKSS